VTPITPTRILVVGGGGREHALAWKLAAEPGANEVIVAPGSDAIERQAGVPISIVSLGPERMQTIARHAGSLELAMAAGAR
jgi:phosphoribosylamine--glycine ligase